MGRSGGGSSHSSGGHSGGGHHGSSHRSSYSSHSSSSFHGGGSYGGGYHSGGYNHHHGGPGYGRPDYGYRQGYNNRSVYVDNRSYYGGPGMPPPPPRPVYRRSTPLSSFISLAVVILILIITASVGKSYGIAVNDKNVAEYAEQQYKSHFQGREDGLLMVITEVGEDELAQFIYGTKANPILDTYQDTLWSYYDLNYNNDLGIQLRGMFEGALEEMTDIRHIKPSKAFDDHCYVDNLNWVDTKSNLVEGAREFYDATGIQPYIMLVRAKTIAKATDKSSGVFKVLIISVAIIIVIMLLISWWKKRVAQKNKEQEDLERTLSTPLSSFGNTSMDDLVKKYDDNSQ